MRFLNRAFLVILLLVSSVSFADHHKETESEAQSSSFNLAELSCWDVMTVDEQQRGTLLFLLYGYVSGVKSELVHDGETIKSILSKLGKYCADNPDDIVLEVMLK